MGTSLKAWILRSITSLREAHVSGTCHPFDGLHHFIMTHRPKLSDFSTTKMEFSTVIPDYVATIVRCFMPDDDHTTADSFAPALVLAVLLKKLNC